MWCQSISWSGQGRLYRTGVSCEFWWLSLTGGKCREGISGRGKALYKYRNLKYHVSLENFMIWYHISSRQGVGRCWGDLWSDQDTSDGTKLSK